MSQGIFVTGELPICVSAAQQVTVKEEVANQNQNKPYVYPALNGKIIIESNNTLFKALHPDKKIDKKNILNFNSNPHLYRSSSSFNLIPKKPKEKIEKLTSDIDDYYKTLQLEKLAKIFEINKNPYSKETIMFFKAKNKNEIEKRSNFYNKVIKPYKKVFNSQNNSEINENNTLNTNELIEEMNNMKNEVSKKLPKLKDYIKSKIEKLNLTSNKIKFPTPMSRSILLSKNRSAPQIKTTNKKRNLYTKYPPKIKMTPTYVRDLKILAAFNKVKDDKLVSYLKLVLHDFN